MGTLQDIIKKELQPTPDGRILGKATLGAPYGFRTCLWGDSMTSQYMGDQITTGSTYNSATGELIVTGALDFSVIDGQQIYFYANNYPALEVQRLTTCRRLDSKHISIQLEKNLPLPAVLDSSIFIKDPRILMGNSWVNWLNIYSGQAFNVVYNGAASGQTAKQCYQNIDSLLAYNPEVVLVQIPGINDWGTPVRFSYDESWGYVEAGLKKILSTGARVIALTTTPVRSGEGRANLQAMSKVAAYRQRLFNFGKRHSNILIVDSYSLTVNPTDTTGLANDWINSVDNIHYSTKGAQKLGKIIWDQIKGAFPVPSSPLPASAIDSFSGSGVTVSSLTRASGVITGTATAHGFITGEIVKASGGNSEVISELTNVISINANTVAFLSEGIDGAITGTVTLGRNRNIFANPLLTLTGGTVFAPITGTAPANIMVQNVSGTGTTAISIAARSDGYGNNVVVKATPSAANIFRVYFTDSGNYLKMLTPGKGYYLEFEANITGVSGSTFNNFSPQMWLNLGGVNYFATAANAGGVTVPFFTDDFTGTFKTGVIKVPDDTTSFSFSAAIDIGFSGSGTQVTINIGRVQLIEVD